jgi:hypothetical protein
MDEMKVRWGLVFSTAILIWVVVFGVFAIWYYSMVLVQYQRRMAQEKRFEAIEAALRQKYCSQTPYPTEAIRQLCEGK